MKKFGLLCSCPICNRTSFVKCNDVLTEALRVKCPFCGKDFDITLKTEVPQEKKPEPAPEKKPSPPPEMKSEVGKETPVEREPESEIERERPVSRETERM